MKDIYKIYLNDSEVREAIRDYISNKFGYDTNVASTLLHIKYELTAATLTYSAELSKF